jgi:hypothetical protein
MKYSQRIGIVAVIAIMGICFSPWSYIASKQITVSGFAAIGTNFGKPGLLNFSFCVLMLVMFVVPAIWAKRTNVFLAAMNLAWAVRNYLLLSSCMMGECPEKKWGLYLLVFLSVVIQLMALLPKLNVKNK